MSKTDSINSPGADISDSGLAHLEQLGISKSEADRQLKLLKAPAYYAVLDRPCTIGDGIYFIDDSSEQELIKLHEEAQAAGRFTKFVPASGAATRMFRELINVLEHTPPIPRKELDELAKSGNKEAKATVYLLAHINHLPFYKKLQSFFTEDLNKLKSEDGYVEILRKILEQDGLNYAQLPKGLLPFHSYEEDIRTSFEEHLVEAAQTIKDKNGICRLHFTVSPEHKEKFEELLGSCRSKYENKYGVKFEIAFSVQKKSTDMLALGSDNLPFLDDQGKPMLRPGGHGSLIENLNDLNADLVYIKNIDNVQPDKNKDNTLLYKKLLSGFLLQQQKQIFTYLNDLHSPSITDQQLDEILTFTRDKLLMPIKSSTWLALGSKEKKAEFLVNELNRPIRVCGMVRNTGEPGGGPFWVIEEDQTLSMQIIEGAQVNQNDPAQAKILTSSTHFNPVNIVCSLKDYKGKPFDLHKFIRHNAIIKTQKSHKGKDLIACERPGLWNGAMADWITLFVDVHESTFTPVKTVLDFLRK